MALVGAKGDGNFTGAAYLFDADPLSPTFGDELKKFTASDAATSDEFGVSVAISGGVAIIGAEENDDAGRNSGSAYLFDADPTSPTFGDELIKLTASDEAADAFFGRSVSIGDGVAIVGGPGSGSGAYLFDADPSSPTFGDELVKLTDDVPFEASVAISDDTAMVFTEFPRGVYLFDADPMSPTFGDELFELIASDAADIEFFGRTVGISGGDAIVGARTNEAGGRTGLAYLFAVPGPLLGDANGDGKVDGYDYLVWAGNYGDNPADDPPGSPGNGDYNDDGVVDGHDYLVWASNYGQGPNDGVAVPEPGACGLVIMGTVMLLSRRRKRGEARGHGPPATSQF
jgi:hypothetical protein